MASLKAIRTRIASVKSTQKITRAMKMVAGARLNRAQARILAMRPYAVKTRQVLASCTAVRVDSDATGRDEPSAALVDVHEGQQAHPEEQALKDKGVQSMRGMRDDGTDGVSHPLLVRRPEKSVLFLVLTSDRGLCGAFNANINRTMEQEWRRREQQGQRVGLMFVGRKGHEYFAYRHAPIVRNFDGVWEELNLKASRRVARALIQPFLKGEVDAVYLVYNEFKSAMTQKVVVEPLLPITERIVEDVGSDWSVKSLDDFVFEPSREALLDRLVPMYVEISILRALLESHASEHGARMTAMDAATNNADDMIAMLTLQYNRARQAAITTELSEIIGGAEALK